MANAWAHLKTLPVFFLSLILIVFASLQMYLSGKVTSDSAFEYDFAKSIWSGGSYFDWSLSPAPSFFPDLFLALLLSPLGMSIVQFNFVISIAQLILLFLVLLRLFSKLNSNFPVEVVLLIAGLMSISNTYGLWFLFQSTNDHLGSLIVGIYAVSLLIQNSFDNKDVMKLSLANFLGVISTSLSLISFVFPLLVFQILRLTRRRYKDNYSFQKLTSIILGASFGVFALISINPNPRINARIRIGTDSAKQGIDNFSLALNYVFNSTRLPLFLFSLMLSVLVFMALLVSLSNIVHERLFPNSASFNLGLIYVLTLFINTPLAIISGSFNDVWGFRYLYMPIFLSVIVLLQTRTNFANHFSGTFIRRGSFYIAAMIVLSSISQFDSRTANVQNENISKIADCVQNLKDRGEINGSGISDYWHARAVTLLTREGIQIEAMTNDLQPFFWMLTFDTLRLPYYDFVLATKQGDIDPFDFKASTMRDLPGIFYKVDCANTPKEILVYSDDSLNNLIQSRNKSFLAGIE